MAFDDTAFYDKDPTLPRRRGALPSASSAPATARRWTKAAFPRSTVHSRRAGFTLIELLAVILIIAILLGAMTHAAQLVIGVAREKRLSLTCRTLESALTRYRDEYGVWSIPQDAANNYSAIYIYGSQYSFYVSGDSNKLWFTMLRATDINATGSGANPKRIPFVDETTIFTVTGFPPKRIPLHVARQANADTAYPFIGVNKRGQTVYFNISIDVDKDTVRVGY